MSVAAARAGSLAESAGHVEQGTVLVEVTARGATRSGTGFFVEPAGVVATALHTVLGARRIRVSLPGRYAASDARLIAASDTWDIALLRVSWPVEIPYPGLELDATRTLNAGTDIAVTGFGLHGSDGVRVPLTFRGIVSGAIPYRGARYYLLDLGARAGLSGSPVYRVDSGAVAGILTRVLSSTERAGPGTAVPIEVVKKLLEDTRQTAGM